MVAMIAIKSEVTMQANLRWQKVRKNTTIK
jgi:hypothetical protein